MCVQSSDQAPPKRRKIADKALTQQRHSPSRLGLIEIHSGITANKISEKKEVKRKGDRKAMEGGEKEKEKKRRGEEKERKRRRRRRKKRKRRKKRRRRKKEEVKKMKKKKEEKDEKEKRRR